MRMPDITGKGVVLPQETRWGLLESCPVSIADSKLHQHHRLLQSFLESSAQGAHMGTASRNIFSISMIVSLAQGSSSEYRAL